MDSIVVNNTPSFLNSFTHVHILRLVGETTCLSGRFCFSVRDVVFPSEGVLATKVITTTTNSKYLIAYIFINGENFKKNCFVFHRTLLD